MIKTFLAELKYIFKSKWRWLEWILVALIPFIYGFLYMNAYWDPFGHTDKLRVAVVNLDNGDKGDLLAKEISSQSSTIAGSDVYNINIEYLDHPTNIPTEEVAKEMVNNDEYQAIIIIPDSYSDMVNELHVELAKAGLTAGVDLPDLIDEVTSVISGIITSHREESFITFYNSFKHSYLAGEMTNFGSGLTKLMVDSIFPNIGSINAPIDALNEFVVKTVDLDILDVNNIGGNIDTYGFGMAPYFISIALWAGALSMTFLIKNDRHIKDSSTLKHYFGKSIMWILTGWVQTTLLITAITFQGVNIGSDQWMIFLLAYFVSFIFSLTVQGIAFSLRYGDLGEFAAVVLLVLQLVSSSGTYPVDVQNQIFQWINPVIPFTYSIDGLRETLYNPQWQEILKDCGILLIFPTVAITTSLGINYWFDRKNKFMVDNVWNYKSFEIHMDDM